MVVKRLSLVAFSLVFMSGTAAYSLDIDSVVQNLRGNLGGWSDVDSTRDQIAKAVSDALAAKQLTDSQAADFKAQLDQITQSEAQAKSGGRVMSFVQSISFKNQLNSLASQIDAAIQASAAAMPDVDALQADLKTKVAAALNASQISDQNARDFNANLTQVANIESAFKEANGGDLNAKNIEILAGKLNKIKADLEQQTKLADSAIPQLDNQRSVLQQRITDALSTRRISQQQAVNFRAVLDHVAAVESSSQAAGSNLSGSMILTLARQMDDIGDQLNAAMLSTGATVPPVGSGLPSAVSTAEIDIKLSQLSRRLDALRRSGSIPTQIASDISMRIDDLKSQESVYKSAESGLTQSQADKLTKDLDQLNVRLDQQISMGINDSTPSKGGGDTSGAASGAGYYTDLGGYWGKDYISQLGQRGIIGGFPDKTFKPDDLITRAQFAAIVVNALSLAPSSSSSQFTDVSSRHWASKAISSAAQAGLITGFPDGTFRPEDKITRAQSLVILSKALPGSISPGDAVSRFSDGASVPAWALPSVNKAASAGIPVNYPDPSQIRPNALATRGEVAALTYQTLVNLGVRLPSIKIGVLQ